MATKFLNGVDGNAQRAVNWADGSSATDLVTLQQLQAYARGMDWKDSVRAATTANITLSGAQTIDGVSVIAGDRVLVKDQTTGSTNGIYVANASTWVRAVDADVSAEVTSGMAVTVTEGTANGDKSWLLITNDPIVLGTTALVFSVLGGSGTSYTAGNGLQLVSTAFSILLDTGSGLLVSGTGLKIDPSYTGLAKRYAVNVPTNATATITHSLGTLDVVVAVYEVSTGARVEPDIAVTSTSVVTLTFASAPTSGQYRCVVLA